MLHSKCLVNAHKRDLWLDPPALDIRLRKGNGGENYKGKYDGDEEVQWVLRGAKRGGWDLVWGPAL